MGDIFYNSRVALLHGDGVDGSTTITDNGPTPKTWTCNGNAQIDTAQYVFGTGSMLFDGTGDYISTPNHADFNFGTGDFAIQCRARFASVVSDQTLISNYQGASNGVTLSLRTGKITFNATGDGIDSQGVTAIVADTWYDIEVSRVSGVLYLFVDGALEDSDANTANITSTAIMALGRDGGLASGYLNGWLDEVRITKGIGGHTTTYTPATEAFADEVEIALMEADLTAPLQTVTMLGGYAIEAAAPIGSTALYTGQVLDIAAPSPTFAMSMGAYMVLAAPSPVLRLVAHDASGENAIDIAAPMASVVMHGGMVAAGTAPMGTLTAALEITGQFTAALTAPMQTAAITGTTSAVASAALTAPMGTLAIYGGAVISVTGPMGTAQAVATAGSVGSITATCPLFDLVVEAEAQAHAEFDLLAPMPQMGRGSLHAWAVAPMARLELVGTAVVAATYEAYALNLNHKSKDPNDELTRYTNFPFTHVVRYRNSYFGVAGDGLYLLEGTTDYAPATPTAPTKIPWAWKTGMTDFGSPNKKNVQSAYFGGRLGPSVTVTLHVGESASQAHSYRTVRGADAQTYRQRFGQGNSARYYALGMAGDEELSLDTIDFNIAELARRI